LVACLNLKKRTLVRIVKAVSLAVETLTIVGLGVLLPLAPIGCAILSNRWHYLRHYRRTLVRSAFFLLALWRTRVISRNVESSLARKWVSNAPIKETIEGSCTHCGRCCVDRACVFLKWDAAGLSQCSIYNNWFWKLTSCGSYPVDARSIAVYACPSFKVIPIKIVPRPLQDKSSVQAGCGVMPTSRKLG
jgi:hypothetical protein